ncbi:MAG: site-specific DNA-methyltransferase [Betaproteobacteria bacterium]|nr:site-specific DNA-methyltransferase [Betaproteobacteria bacterium]
MIYKRSATVCEKIEVGDTVSVFNGDCEELLKRMPSNSVDLTISSPPYCMGKEYEVGSDVEDFIAGHGRLLPEIARVTKPGGSICWQVGYHVQKNHVVPLDYLIFDIMKQCPEIKLRNRIIWTFGSGLHCSKRFSGRHETILWFSKGDNYQFDLDAVRVPQKYPGKKASKGARKGEFSGNPLGKNPSDVWDIPNVKANHVEKTEHPCQFPVALAVRCIRALTTRGDLVFDPFCGVMSSGVAALAEGRRFLGAEMNQKYLDIGAQRIKDLADGVPDYRPLEQEVYQPNGKDSVSSTPAHFISYADTVNTAVS